MGYVINEYIIVSGFYGDHVNQARQEAAYVFGEDVVTQPMPHKVNRSSSFFINSSGSKSGWLDAEEHSKNMDRFMSWCRKENLFNKVLRIHEHEEIERSSIVERLEY